MNPPPLVTSVNVGRPQLIASGGRTEKSSIRKQPAEGRVAVRGVNVDGDDQADRSVHGGPHKAVYCYAREDADWWESELGRELPNGMFGENLTTRGIDLRESRIGDRWRIGSALFEVSEPRFPCWKLGARFQDPLMVRRFAKALRTGAYLRIVEEGEIGSGDAIEVVEQADHDVTIDLFARAYLADQSLLGRLLEAPIADNWRDWIESRMPHGTGRTRS